MQKIITLKKGLLTGITMIILQLFIFYILKQSQEGPLQYAVYSVYTAGIVWSIFAFSKKAGPGTKFGAYFSAGFKTFILATLLMVIYTFIFLKMNPQILEAKIVVNDQLALQEGNHTPAEIASNAKQMRSIFIPMMLALTTFMYLFLGALISATTTGVIMQLKKQ